MSKARTIPDEQIIAALISNGTIRATAQALNMGERTIYDRMKDEEFTEKYKAAKADIIRKAVFDCNAQLGKAVTTITEIMENTDNNPAIRLQAAQTIINTAGKFAQRLADTEQDAMDARRRGFEKWLP